MPVSGEPIICEKQRLKIGKRGDDAERLWLDVFLAMYSDATFDIRLRSKSVV